MSLPHKIKVITLLSALLSFSVMAEIPTNAVWIDVRTPGEFEQGHLPLATLIPYDGIEKGVAALGLAKDTPIFLYCASGGRSGKAKLSLEAMDYTAVTNAGGLADAEKLIAEENSKAD